MRRIIFILVLCLIFVSNCFFVDAQKIKVYFNRPVNTTVSSGVNAIYLNQAIDDTLIAYINRAHYSIDIAVYNYIQSGNMSNIASAVNNAFANGVKIRWIYNGSSSNSGLNQLNVGINTLGSPTSSNYNIMHNKFMVIDAGSVNPDDAIVWTGSCNWDSQQFNSDVNNVIIFQDSALAHAYTVEFNEMWGGSGIVPNLSLSKFGPFKSNNTQHFFNIGGSTVELYFSPSDNTNTHILNAISSANDDLYFGVYTFTLTQDADSIAGKFQNQNVYTAGIVDQYSQGFSAYPILSSALNTKLKVYNQSNSIYHSKMVIADPCSPGSDPLVETGSHNWTLAANTQNDENTVIVHNATIANIYYQSFFQNFTDLGGTLVPCNNSSSISENDISGISIFPNPANNYLRLTLNDQNATHLFVSNSVGEVVLEKEIENENLIDTQHFSAGIYFVKVIHQYHVANFKIVVEH